MEDGAFVQYVGQSVGDLPGVEAVTLGGSRAEGTSRPDSDWDFSLYYRGHFEPQTLRDLGWAGQVGELGSWSAIEGGVFNGGAWLEIDGRRSDIHYRDLETVERVLASAEQGRFDTEPLWFHLAPVPSYILLAELAATRVLTGTVPPVQHYPKALQREAPHRWWEQAQAEFDYARRYHAKTGRTTQALGLTARAASCAAHAVLAARGRWITNEKQLFVRAELTELDTILGRAHEDSAALRCTIDEVEAICRNALGCRQTGSATDETS